MDVAKIAVMFRHGNYRIQADMVVYEESCIQHVFLL